MGVPHTEATLDDQSRLLPVNGPWGRAATTTAAARGWRAPGLLLLLLLLAGPAVWRIGRRPPSLLKANTGSAAIFEGQTRTVTIGDSHIRETGDFIFIGPLPFMTVTGEPRAHNLTEMKGLDLLAFSGYLDTLIMPSLHFKKLAALKRWDAFAGVTIVVGMNTDAHACAVGLVLEPQGIPLTLQAWNALAGVKFHPGVFGSQLRVEGMGGFSDQNMGFTAKGWTMSGRRLSFLDITLTREGVNTVGFKGADEDPLVKKQRWSKSWSHRLFDGVNLPNVFAWMETRCEAGKPLLIGHISLVLQKKRDVRFNGSMIF